jgi:hypothetical protein
MAGLETVMAGALKGEMENFDARQAELGARAQELQATISTSYGKAKADAIASLAEVNQSLGDNAAAHEEATKRILYGYAEQALAAQVAAGKMTAPEQYDALLTLANKMGLVSQTDVDAIRRITKETEILAEDKNVENWASDVIGALTPLPDIINQAGDSMQERLSRLKLTVGLQPVDVVPTVMNQAGDSMQERLNQLNANTAVENMKALPTAVGSASADVIKAGDSMQERLDKLNAEKAAKTIPTQFAPIRKTFLDNITYAQNFQSGIDALHGKTIEIITKYTTRGEIPEGVGSGRAGGGMVYPGNVYTVGEQGPEVLHLFGNGAGYVTPHSSSSASAAGGGGDTYVYNTNINNPLAAAMYLDRQRREKLDRSNARMGVA